MIKPDEGELLLPENLTAPQGRLSKEDDLMAEQDIQLLEAKEEEVLDGTADCRDWWEEENDAFVKARKTCERIILRERNERFFF